MIDYQYRSGTFTVVAIVFKASNRGKGMYKAALLLVIICILPLSTIGETLHYGVKTGVTFANQDFDYTEFGSPNFNTYSGWDIGFFAEMELVPAISLASELHYVQKGHVIKVHEQTYDRVPTGHAMRSFSSHIDYLSLSVLAKTSLSFGGARTYLFAGPRIDIKVGQNATLGMEVVYDEFESSVWGGTIGIGQEFPLSSCAAALVEVYYHDDFTEACQTNWLTVKNRAWGIVVGVEL